MTRISDECLAALERDLRNTFGEARSDYWLVTELREHRAKDVELHRLAVDVENANPRTAARRGAYARLRRAVLDKCGPS